jgi:hypothetical protein
VTTWTIADAQAYLLARSCGECGTALPSPGDPCPACGVLPEVTGPELAEHLDGPRALAAVQARKLRAEASELQDAMLARHLEADRVLHLAALEERRGRAQGDLEVAVAQRREKTGPLKAAQKAESKALAALEQARGEHAEVAKAEETACRMRAGVTAETEAALRLRLATDVLARYEREHRAAVAARETAQGELDAAAERVSRMEAARDTAARAVAEPGRVPVSLETMSADLLRLLVSGALDAIEMVEAQVPVQWLAGVTGYAAALESDTRRRTREEAEEAARTQPVVLRQGQTGMVTAVGNPFAPGTPRQRGVGPVGDGILQTPGLGGL